MNKRLWITLLAIVGVVVLAGLFRLYDIQNYPPGLFPDEAANGEDALLVLDGDVRPFYLRGNGREGLYYFLEALSIKVFGIGVWQLHLVSAVIGVLTVLAVYFATRVWFGRLAGFIAAFFLATNHWHVTMSRTGFRAILIPLFVAAFTAFVGFTIQSVKKKQVAASYIYAGLAGAAFMGGFYTYIAYRVMVGVVGGVFVLLVLAAMHPKIGFPHFRRYGKQILIAVITGLIVFAPLGWFFIQQPDTFVGRAGQVSVFNEELQDEFGGGTLLGTIMFSARETIYSFFAGEGDLNWRHNVVGYPLLNPFVAVLFLLGFAWSINGTVLLFWKMIKGRQLHFGMMYPYLILILVGMLAPVISTAEGIPHGLRSIGLVAPIFILVGAAGAVVIHWVQVRASKEPVRAIAYGVIVGLALLGAFYDGALYFFVSRNDSEAAYEYRADLTEVSAYINDYAREHPDKSRPVLSLDTFSLQTIHFLTSVVAHDYLEHPDEDLHKYEFVEPADSYLRELAVDEIIIFTQSTIFDAEKYEDTYGDEIEFVESRLNRFGEEIMRVYKHAGEVEGAVDRSLEVDLDAVPLYAY